MKTVTFHVLEGVDKGRVFRDIPIPVTIGREEGNLLRLNDERISRFHAKVQLDNDDVILTDLESTNGTRVNGYPIAIRRLRPGDQIGLGRSLLMFGSSEEIAARHASLQRPLQPTMLTQSKTISTDSADLNFVVTDMPTEVQGFWTVNEGDLPPLPQKMSPAQAARLSEILDFLHRGLTSAMETIRADEPGTEVHLNYGEWQKVQAVQMLLARYLRAVTEPDVLVE